MTVVVPKEGHAWLGLTLPKRPKPQKKSTDGWGPNDPMHITEKTKVTVCPTPTYSFHTNTYEPS